MKAKPDKIHVKELQPVDSAAAILRCQGHFLVHLAYFLGAQIFVTTQQLPIYCLETGDDGAISHKSSEYSPINYSFAVLKWVHLTCFILQFIVYISQMRQLTVEEVGIQKLFNFITLPIYLFAILNAELGLYTQIFDHLDNSTKDKFLLKGEVCFSEKPGNVYEWIRIEVISFVAQIFVMVGYLMRTRFIDH